MVIAGHAPQAQKWRSPEHAALDGISPGALRAVQDLNLTFIGSSSVPVAALRQLGQYHGLTQLALEGSPRSVPTA